MDTKITRRVFDIIYPLFIYYVMYYCLQVLFAYIFQGSFGSLFCLLLAAICCLPFQFFFYKRAIVIRRSKQMHWKELLEAIGWILVVVFLGIACNVIVTHFDLMRLSPGYASASEILSDGDIVVRILTNALVVPLLEEVLYRGVICGQVEAWGSVGSVKNPKPESPSMGYQMAAVLLSAFLFGALHFNVVQFLYAFVIGIFLGVAYIRTHRLWVVVAAHGLTNLVVLLVTM